MGFRNPSQTNKRPFPHRAKPANIPLTVLSVTECPQTFRHHLRCNKPASECFNAGNMNAAQAGTKTHIHKYRQANNDAISPPAKLLFIWQLSARITEGVSAQEDLGKDHREIKLLTNLIQISNTSKATGVEKATETPSPHRSLGRISP